MNRRFSAAAVITAFNPGQRRVEQIIDEQMSGIEDPRQRIATAFRIFREETERHHFEDGDRLHCLQVFHNPFAEIPLPNDFAGPHDEQWAVCDGAYQAVAQGIGRNTVPGIEVIK
jgi:hypothetical protein